MRTLVMITLAAALAAAGDAAADTQYHFSGAACQPERPEDYAIASTTGAGFGSTDTSSFPLPLYATCPVTGLESANLGQIELKARVWDNQATLPFSGYWQVYNENLGTIYTSSTKYACAAADGCTSPTSFTGGSTLRWSGSALHPFIFSGYSTYSFRAHVPGRCYDSICNSISRVQAYWVTHNNP